MGPSALVRTVAAITEALDRAYRSRWAAHLGLTALRQRALEGAGILWIPCNDSPLRRRSSHSVDSPDIPKTLWSTPWSQPAP